MPQTSSAGLARRLALLLVLAALAVPPALRALAAHPDAWRPWSAAGRGPPGGCAAAGRGVPPRHWLGCATDPGPPRALTDEERLVLGLPLDLNRAGARGLAFVPGLTPGLARTLVEDRQARGPFAAVEELSRVAGIGPQRLARAIQGLVVETPPPPR